MGWHDETGYLITTYDVVGSDLTLFAKWAEDSESARFLKKFMADSYTLKTYYTISDDGDIERDALCLKKEKKGGLASYIAEYPRGKSFIMPSTLPIFTFTKSIWMCWFLILNSIP